VELSEHNTVMELQKSLWGRLLLVAAGTGLMSFCALSVLSSGYIDGQFIPQNADAFYHARRILDAVMSGEPVVQFDALMHVPEGSWITWPWGYDQALAWIVSAIGPYDTEQQAARVLFHIPLAFIPVAIGLMVWLTWQLRLSLGMGALAVLAYAATPYIFMQYSVGNVDHHFAEQIWVLLLLNCAVWMVRFPASRVASPLLGFVLGSGIAIQNGLFLLPVILVLALAVLWLRGLPMPDRTRLIALAISLLLAVLVVCFPSQPWRNGEFDYLLLSWFQFYVAAVCATYIIWMGYARPSGRSLVPMVIVGIAALVACYVPIASGAQFAAGQSASIQNIAEAISPYNAVSRLGAARSTRLFTWLVWFSLPAMMLSAWWSCRSRKPELVVFAAMSVILLLLMQSQIRFIVMGIMSLVVVLPLAAEELAARKPAAAKSVRLAVVLLTIICFLPTRGVFRTVWVAGNDYSYMALRSELESLAEKCAQDPGVVVAPMDAGHWIRYHTDCSVVANAFVLSPIQVAKVEELYGLLKMTPAQLREVRPDVKYVLASIDVAEAFRAGLIDPTEADIQSILPHEWELTRGLLRTDTPPPVGYRQISAARAPKGGVYAKVFAIEP
jgi:hypothetical protein